MPQEVFTFAEAQALQVSALRADFFSPPRV